MITDQFGQVKARRDFMPFGEELYTGVGGRTGDTGLKYSFSQDDIRQKFTGYQKDNETGLDFAEARMYENRLGRFTAVDPYIASGKLVNPQTINRYIYVGNNPVILTGPMGLEWYHNKSKNIFEWSDDNKSLATGEEINDSWSLVTSHVYWAGETIGYVVLDPQQRDWTTGFETREDAVHFLDPGQNVSLIDGIDEMMTGFDMVALPVGIVRQGGKVVVREGAEYLAERLIKKTTSQILRVAAEKELVAGGKKVTTQALNRLVGLAAEGIAEKQLIQEGYEILGSQVTARLANGDLRYIDRLVKSPSGEIFSVEIKSGGSIYSEIQQARDAL